MKKVLLLLMFVTFSVEAQSFIENHKIKIDTTEIVQIGSIKQFVDFKGNNKENPILLILHGGPGRSLLQFSDIFTNKLRNDFTIVNWDQRETSKTLDLNSSPNLLTVSLFQQDAVEMVQFLLKKFNRKKIFLVSHSWGSVMGFYLAKNYPDLISAYIPISPVVDCDESSSLSLIVLKKWAKKEKMDVAIEELNTINVPFKTETDFFLFQKWLFVHNEVDGVLTEDFKKNYYKWMETWFPIWKENAKSNLFQIAPEINCPIYFFVGKYDNQTHFKITKKYFKALNAENKKFICLKKSGHTIFNTEPDKVQEEIIKIKSILKLNIQ